MLMFDNVIFASFIPQFLMILGFFSALISAGISHMNQEEILAEHNISIQTTALNDAKQHKTPSTYHFTNHKTPEKAIKSEPISLNLSPHNIKETIIDISLYFIPSKKVFYTLFMRPPPSFSLYLQTII